MNTRTRRQFLQTTTLGLAAGALSRETALDARQAGAAPAGANRIANIIDCHGHWVGPTVVDLLKGRTSPRPPQGAGWTDIDARLREMDKTGVKRQVLAWVGASFDAALPAADARPLWRAQNDDVAAIVKKYPARFSGLASLPTANVAWAADELDRAHANGLIGAVLPLDAFISLAGARALAPIFEVAQKHRSHIFVHRGAASPDIPGQHLEGAVNPYFGLAEAGGGRGGGRGGRDAATSGDNTQARTLLATAAHLATGVITLALTDFLDAYPDVTVQVAMMGGAISYVAEHIQMAAEEAGSPVAATRFTRVYLDTGQSGRGPRGIAMAAKVFGADRILFGTDSGPTTTMGPTVESVNAATLTAEEKRLIFSENARRLLAAKGVTAP
jgi:predicted TIM-barrel fold metal-dependent hydrolase